MRKIEVLGPNQTGSHLTLNDDEGNRYLLPISTTLYDALRQAEQLASENADSTSPKNISPSQSNSTLITTTASPTGTHNFSSTSKSIPSPGPSAMAIVAAPTSHMRPKEIQELLRAGYTPEEIAQEYNLDLKRLQIYESPILAERNYICKTAKQLCVGGEGGPTVEEITLNRLATRGVDPNSITWSAVKPGEESWQLCADFLVDGKPLQALWSVDIAAKLVIALNNHARWLTETDAHSENYHGLIDMTDDSVTRLDARRVSIPADSDPLLDSILADINAHRGTRKPVLIPGDEFDEDDFSLDFKEGDQPDNNDHQPYNNFAPSSSGENSTPQTTKGEEDIRSTDELCEKSSGLEDFAPILDLPQRRSLFARRSSANPSQNATNAPTASNISALFTTKEDSANSQSTPTKTDIRQGKITEAINAGSSSPSAENADRAEDPTLISLTDSPYSSDKGRPPSASSTVDSSLNHNEKNTSSTTTDSVSTENINDYQANINSLKSGISKLSSEQDHASNYADVTESKSEVPKNRENPDELTRKNQISISGTGTKIDQETDSNSEPKLDKDPKDTELGSDSKSESNKAKSKRKQRRSVPSWDEIVFGTKSDSKK